LPGGSALTFAFGWVERRNCGAGLPSGGHGSTRTRQAGPSKGSLSGLSKGVVRAVLASHTLVSRFGGFCWRASAQRWSSRRSRVFRDQWTAANRRPKGRAWPASDNKLRFGVAGAGQEETPLGPFLSGGGDREERGRCWRHVASCVLQRFEGQPLSAVARNWVVALHWVFLPSREASIEPEESRDLQGPVSGSRFAGIRGRVSHRDWWIVGREIVQRTPDRLLHPSGSESRELLLFLY
jgi:hypothetical protein